MSVISGHDYSYGDKGFEFDFVYGEQGDDEIWGASYVDGKIVLDGGSGDDKLYAGARNYGAESFLYGGSGKDIIRTDWFEQRGGPLSIYGDFYIFGDHKYGTDALDKDLWGDADEIYNGYGNDYDVEIVAGDGDDLVHTGNEWYYNKVHAGNGDDTIYLGDGNAYVYAYGDDGDDTIVPKSSYEDVDNGGVYVNNWELIMGGKGNDLVRGSHGKNYNDGYGFLHGNDGDDKLYGGDESGY